MPLDPGTTLGSYHVTAKIGEGGMGEVYRARDTKLDRDVALKVLPPAFTDDPDRLARFEREAKVLASLNHPNIGGIYGLEEAEGQKALVLELVEGPTLADRIAQGPIPVDEALPIAKQIAEALEAAHEAGVIHRDLKPANIKVREDGTVKVLDFGLAKALDTAPVGDPSQSPTLTAAATQMGMIMGTAAYMSPEQARGKPVDKRSDIWAFGAVLYEMLSGQRAFEGEDVSVTLANVINQSPDWEQLPGGLSPSLRTYLQRCLDKEPKQRVADMQDVRLAMEGAFDTVGTAPADSLASSRLQFWQRPVPAALILLLVAAAVLLIGGQTRTPDEPTEVMRFVTTPSQSGRLFTSSQSRSLVISFDGRQIVYSAGGFGRSTRQLVSRTFDQLEEVPLRGTNGGIGPFVRPDGQWVGFLDRERTTLQKVPIFGGPSEAVAESPFPIYGATWDADDHIIFGTREGGLFRVADDGDGELEVLTAPEEGSHRWPTLIPGANAVVFVAASELFARTAAELVTYRLDTGEVTRLGLAGVNPYYVSTGHLVYASANGTVLGVGFDPSRLEVIGNPVPLIDNVRVKNGGAAEFSVSDEGRLVYVAGAPQGEGLRSLVWVDRDGTEEVLSAEPRAYAYPRVSPDGRSIAVGTGGQARSLWIWDIARRNLTALPVEGRPLYAHWTPDSRRVIFRQAEGRLFSRAADGAGGVEELGEAGGLSAVNAVTPDGKGVVFTGLGNNSSMDLFVMWLDEGRRVEALLATEFNEGNAALSPDGRWMAYESDSSGQIEIYARPFPDVEARRVPVSTAGGIRPVWSPDGRQLFYQQGDQLMSVPVQLEPSASFGTPVPLFEGAYATGPGRNYDVSPDGRFVMLKDADPTIEEGQTQIVVVTNWFQELTERVPTN